MQQNQQPVGSQLNPRRRFCSTFTHSSGEADTLKALETRYSTRRPAPDAATRELSARSTLSFHRLVAPSPHSRLSNSTQDKGGRA